MSSNNAPSKLALRVKSKKSQQSVLRDVDPQQSMEGFLKKLETLTDVPWEKISIMKGFPPKKVDYTIDNVVACLGLVNQDTIIVDLDTSINNKSGPGGFDLALWIINSSI